MPDAEPQRPSYDELVSLVASQAARIAELEVELAELKRSLGSSGGRRGKPFGAPGATMRLVDDPDSTIECRPALCAACDSDLAGAPEFSRQRRQVIELPPPPKAEVTEFQVVSLVCPCCAAVTVGQAPAGVSGRV